MPDLALAAALLMAASPAPKLSTMEQRYVEARDAATARFDKGPIAGDPEFAGELEAIGVLEVQLREIIGPVRLPGLASPGRLAYEGFWGVGSTPRVADGMVFDWSGNTLFVTTRALYMRAVGALRPMEDASVEDEMVSNTIMGGHAAFTAFAEVPIRHGPSTKRARAVVGVVAQDIGPFPPDSLVVQLERGDRVYIVGGKLEPRLEQVASCEARFKKDVKKIPNGANDVFRLEYQAFHAYGRCVRPVITARPTFTSLVRRAQAIVDHLEAGDEPGLPSGR